MNGQNNYRYGSADMDKWLNAAQNATTLTALKEVYAHIQEVFAEGLPCLCLERRTYPDEVREGLKGYDHSPPTTGISSTGVGGNRYDDQICRRRDYRV